MEQIIHLNGEWELHLNDQAAGTILLPGTTSEAKKQVSDVPAAWDHLTDPYAFTGTARFHRRIHLPKADAYTLVMERTRISHVIINGIDCGTQDSFIAPHRYDITSAIQEGDNDLTIEISNTGYKVPGGHMTSADTQSNWNGIVGEFAVHCHNTVRINSIFTSCDYDGHAAQITCNLTNLTTQDYDCKLSVEACSCHLATTSAKELSEASIERIPLAVPGLSEGVMLHPGDNSVKLYYDLTSDCHLWDEYNPTVYELTLSVYDAKETSGCIPLEQNSTYFGMKDFTHDGTHFTMNGRMTFLRGKHDGMSFPLTGYAPMDVLSWLRIFLIAREYGINHYRYHTCCPPQAAFIAADLVGMILQPELSFWGTFHGPEDDGYDATAQNFLRDEGFRILAEYGNHPSFCMMTMGNELWGNASALNELVGAYKAVRPQILYAQGSNNFFWTPNIQPNDDFFSGVRLAIGRQIRGSFAACDVPHGHIQIDVPATEFTYDDAIRPEANHDEDAIIPESTAFENVVSGTVGLEHTESGNDISDYDGSDCDDTVEIQFGTGVKRVQKDTVSDELIPHIPVIAHEVGQYQFYPDFKEIPSYTGVLQPENLRIFQKRIEDAGLGSMKEKFFRAAGNLAVACYKDEIETMMRSRYMAGFQLLDLTDFPGQGTALVGILNPLYQNKGIISAGMWRSFCSDAVLQASFPSYIVRAGEHFTFHVSLRYHRPKLLENALLTMTLAETWGGCGSTATGSCEDCASKDGSTPCETVSSLSRAKKISVTSQGYQELATASFTIPEKDTPSAYTLTISIKDTDIHNSYTLWSYPRQIPLQDLPIAETREEAEELARTNRYSLLLLGNEENSDSIEGFYTSDFWNYTMFRNIAESMGKKVAPGTLGLYINQNHPALADFPSRSYSTPQWYRIVTASRSTILDDTDIEPIVWTIDNVERNHKLGLLYEMPSAHTPGSTILVCTSDLATLLNEDVPEAYQFLASLVNYVISESE